MRLQSLILSLFFLFLLSVAATADEPGRLSVLATATDDAPRPTLRTALQQECYAALAERREAYEQVKTPDEVRDWQQARREFFLKQLGGFPERTPLNPRVAGRLEGDGYTLEKVIFESRPNHHVTGNLYLPKSAPPYPAVIVPCGHSYNGKASEAYQRVSILMAINGIAAFCYDPIGQGERYQTFAPDGTPLSAEYDVNPNSLRRLEGIPGGPRFNPVEEHTLVGIGSILVGRNTATYRIYDGMRCVDYLVSREDIDGQRIGCTGQSGGGTLTAYLMALDERIVCATPACYLTTFERLLATSGPQDAEQNIFGQIAFGMDQGDYVLMRAPKPTCLVAGTHDSTFDIRGTWEIFREGKRFFSRLGHPERIDMVEADSPHTFTSPLRVGCVRWMRRWLLEQDDAITEPDFPVWSEEDLQCTPQGQVMLLDGERSVFDFNREEATRLAEQRNAADISPDEFLDFVRRTAGARPWEEVPARQARPSGEVQRQGYQIEKLLLEAEDQLPLPALAFVPERQQGEAILYLHGEGKSIDAGQGGPIEKLVRQGHLVLAVDLCGIGETAADAAEEGRRRHWSEPLFGPDGEEFWLAYLLGESLIGLRTEDALAAAKFLQHYRTSGNEPRTVRVVGIGRAGLPALHAVALERERFLSLTLEGTLSSWQEVVEAPLGNEHLTETVHGALQVYDLPDLIDSIGKERVTINNPLAPPR
jgi:dienelactone hydrolase